MAEAPGASDTVDDSGIVPPAAPQVAPAPAAHVHEPDVAPTGSASVIGAATTADGPALEATTVYTTLVPGVAVVAPSVLVTDRSARGVAGAVAVAVLSAGTSSGTPDGPATVAVFESVPVNAGSTVPVIVYVAVPLTARLAVVASDPEPEAAPQLEPAEAEQVHDAPVTAAGSESTTEIGAVPELG